MNINSHAPVVSPTCSFTVNQSNALTTRIRSGFTSHPFGSRENLNQLDIKDPFLPLYSNALLMWTVKKEKATQYRRRRFSGGGALSPCFPGLNEQPEARENP